MDNGTELTGIPMVCEAVPSFMPLSILGRRTNGVNYIVPP
jgi:hypothetical protein